MTVTVLFRGVHIGKTTGKPTGGARSSPQSAIGCMVRLPGFPAISHRINGTGIWKPSFDEFSCFSCRYVPYIIEAAKIVHIVHLFSSFCWVIFDAWKQLMIRVKKNRKRKPPSEMQGTMMHPIHHGVQPELTPLGRRKKGPTKSMVMFHLDLTLPKMKIVGPWK